MLIILYWIKHKCKYKSCAMRRCLGLWHIWICSISDSSILPFPISIMSHWFTVLQPHSVVIIIWANCGFINQMSRCYLDLLIGYTTADLPNSTVDYFVRNSALHYITRLLLIKVKPNKYYILIVRNKYIWIHNNKCD